MKRKAPALTDQCVHCTSFVSLKMCDRFLPLTLLAPLNIQQSFFKALFLCDISAVERQNAVSGRISCDKSVEESTNPVFAFM